MNTLGTEAGFTDFAIPVMWNCIIWAVILMIGFSVYYKIWKIKPGTKAAGVLEAKAKLDRSQWITVAGILVMVVMVVGFGINVGLASFFVAAMLVIAGGYG